MSPKDPATPGLDRRSIGDMWLRRAFFAWMIPAAFLLPLWLLIGWAVTGAGAWAFLWVLFLAIPGVFVWQLLLTLLVRARGTVRAHRAVSWWDVLGFAVWHALVIALGFFDPAWWAATFAIAIVVGVALFWLSLWQLWREARPTGAFVRVSEGMTYLSTDERTRPEPQREPQVIIVNEKHDPAA